MVRSPVIEQDNESSTFIAPRAKSRKGDAHIRIEVHKDPRIIQPLPDDQHDKNLDGMNLLFYNFNDFNNDEGGRPKGGAGGKRLGPQT